MEAEGWSGILILDSERLRQEVGERKCQWQRKARRRPGETCDRSFLEKGVQRKSRVRWTAGKWASTLSCGFLGGGAQHGGLPLGVLELTDTPQPGFGLPAGAAVPTASDTAPRQHAVAPRDRAGPVTVGAGTAETEAGPGARGPRCGAADDRCGGCREE